jgi:hypothetical protein
LRVHLPLRGLNTSPSEQAATHLPLALIFSFAGHAHTPMVVRPMLGGQAGFGSQVWLRKLKVWPAGQSRMRMTGAHVPLAVGIWPAGQHWPLEVTWLGAQQVLPTFT